MLRLGERRARERARSVVIASGVRYRRLAVENLDAFEGASVHYWASPIEAKLCAGQEVVLVGAGNSAGQAMVYLATRSRKSGCWCAAPSFAATMSRYLVDRIGGLANVEVLTQTEVCALEGADGMLEAVRWRHTQTGEKVRRPDPPSVPVHRRRPQHRMAQRLRRGARSEGLCPDRRRRRRKSPLARDQPARRICDRRCPRGLDQAGRGRRRRRRASGRRPARLSGGADASRNGAYRATHEAVAMMVMSRHLTADQRTSSFHELDLRAAILRAGLTALFMAVGYLIGAGTGAVIALLSRAL